ncbi:MAG: hypothetical protein ACYCPO_07845 [Acidobacteriaceae bacterium]
MREQTSSDVLKIRGNTGRGIFKISLRSRVRPRKSGAIFKIFLSASTAFQGVEVFSKEMVAKATKKGQFGPIGC